MTARGRLASRAKRLLDGLSEHARNNYFFARAVVGREFSFPVVRPRAMHRDSGRFVSDSRGLDGAPTVVFWGHGGSERQSGVRLIDDDPHYAMVVDVLRSAALQPV